MIKAIFSVLIMCSLATISLRAQDSYIASEVRDLKDRLNWNKTIQTPSADIQGSPYLNEEFQPGDVYYDGKYKITQLPIRYNLHTDEMEYKEKGAILAFADPNSIDKIIIGNRFFVYIKENTQNKVSGFVQIWNEQYPAITTKIKVDFFPKEEAKPIVEAKPARYERGHSKHYLMKNEYGLEKIGSVKKLIKSLGKHESELSAFAKKEKISGSKPEQMAKMLEYYHRLK